MNLSLRSSLCSHQLLVTLFNNFESNYNQKQSIMLTTRFDLHKGALNTLLNDLIEVFFVDCCNQKQDDVWRRFESAFLFIYVHTIDFLFTVTKQSGWKYFINISFSPAWNMSLANSSCLLFVNHLRRKISFNLQQQFFIFFIKFPSKIIH